MWTKKNQNPRTTRAGRQNIFQTPGGTHSSGCRATDEAARGTLNHCTTTIAYMNQASLVSGVAAGSAVAAASAATTASAAACAAAAVAIAAAAAACVTSAASCRCCHPPPEVRSRPRIPPDLNKTPSRRGIEEPTQPPPVTARTLERIEQDNELLSQERAAQHLLHAIARSTTGTP